jgi:hypothetical protein
MRQGGSLSGRWKEMMYELCGILWVHTVFHGHHHDCVDYRAGEAQRGFAVHGVGFCGITDGDGRVVLPGWYDEARRSRMAKPE